MKWSALVAIAFSFFLSTAYAASASQQDAKAPDVVDGSNIVDSGGSLSVVDDQQAQKMAEEQERRRQDRLEQNRRAQPPQTDGQAIGQNPPRPGQPQQQTVPSSFNNSVSGPNPQAQGTPEAPTGSNN